ncbi:hypothetical protein EDB80DRAFT_870783 [Ilyonectria destructans]|nr:hypothetical protein EDB80DRAFT_870783 [Ilyonectria destructans]
MSSRTTSSTLPQGFSVYQPALGAQLQFLPAVGTPELDELLNTYIPGPASAQEKRASVSLDFLEYSHLTGQSFKFYAVYSMATPVESPATVSPVMSTWDWSQASTSSRSPTSQQARASPKSGSSRHQADFSHIPGMKIMTKDGLDVTNSASRGSKTKEQRDHAHLMRIIKACDSCKRKKIRCDPSHKKRGVSQASQSQPAARATKKVRTVAQEARVATPAIVPQTDFSVSDSSFAIGQSFAHVDLEMLTPALPALEPWEEFIQYPTAELSADYDFFYDPEGYLSPESSSSLSAFSTKPVTPNSQQDLSGPSNLSTGEVSMPSPQLPFNQTDSIHNYVDFNLFSPQSCFSEDDHMVPIEMSRQVASQSQSLQSSLLRSDQSPGGSGGDGGLIDNGSDAASSYLSGDEERTRHDPYRDPGLDAQQDYSPSSSSLSSDVFSHSMSWIEEPTSMSTSSLDNSQSDGDNVIFCNTDVDSAASIVERVSTLAALRQPSGLDDSTTATIVTHDGLNTLADRVVLNNVVHSLRAVARGGSESLVDTAGILSTAELTAIANVVSATPATTSAISRTVVVNDSESSDGLQVTTSGASLTESRTVNAGTVSSGMEQSSIRRGIIAAATMTTNSGVRQSPVSRRTVGGATIIANSGLPHSSVERGRVAYATVDANSDASTQSLSEHHSIAATNTANMANTQPLTYTSRVDQGVSGVLLQASPDQALSLSSVDVPRVEAQAQTYYAPFTSAIGGGISLMPLMTSALVVLASGSAKSPAEQYLTTMMSVVLLLFAIAGWLRQSNPSLRTSYGQPSNSLSGKAKLSGIATGFAATVRDRLEAFQSQASNGKMSVSRVVSRSGCLIAV